MAAKPQLLESRLDFSKGFRYETQHKTLHECPGCLDHFGVKHNGFMVIGEQLKTTDRRSLTVGLIRIEAVAVKGEIQRQNTNLQRQRNLLTGLGGMLIQPDLHLRTWLKPIRHSLRRHQLTVDKTFIRR